jgi:hypothetical protein
MRWSTGLGVVVAALAVAGCEDSAEGFGGGVGKAIGLLLLLGLVLPATVAGIAVLTVTTLRRRRGVTATWSPQAPPAPPGAQPEPPAPPPPPPPRPLP